MEILGTVGFFILGAIVGSFLNVVILRYNTGAGVGGRSRCFSCGKTIQWYDLLPIVSFLYLRGRCRFCKSKISFQYPLVEIFTGVLFSAVFLKYSSFVLSLQSTYYLLFTIDLAVMAVLVVITVYDFKHKIIPDFLAFLFSLLAITFISVSVPREILLTTSGFISHFFSGPIIALPFLVLWLVSRGAWIGLGDAKLALGIGWFLGVAMGLSAVVIGFWIGAAVSLLLLLLGRLNKSGVLSGSFLSSAVKNLTIKSEIPLAPFLILGFLVVYFFGIDVMGLGSLIM